MKTSDFNNTEVSSQLITLVVPVYNEETNVRILFDQVVSAMTNVHLPWEILFVDDGSSDNSLNILKQMSANDSRVHFISLEKNCGQSAALAAGFKEAKGNIIITLDADLQNDPADISTLLTIFNSGDYDLVCGWRVNRQDTYGKRLASRFANAFRNFVINDGVHDTGCSLKVFKAAVAKELPVFKGMHRFFPALIKMYGGSVTECPVNHRARVYGESKYGIVDRALSASFDLLGVFWLRRRFISYKIKDRN